MSVEKLIAEIRELDRDTVPVKATFESGLPPEEFLYLKRNHILTLCRIIEVQREALKSIGSISVNVGEKQSSVGYWLKKSHECVAEVAANDTSAARQAFAESDRIAKEGKE